MITLFQPDRLWHGGRARKDADGRWLNGKPSPVGVWVSGEDWAGLVRWVSTPVLASSKEEHGAFTLAKLNGGRCAANVEIVTALGIDGDETGMSVREVHGLLSAYRHVVYSTFSSTLDAPRWRAIVALSRPETADEHYAYVGNAYACLASAGVPVDQSTKDPCRLWYLPAKRRDGHFAVFAADVAPFDVDAALETARELEADRRREAMQRASARPLASGIVARARAYVAKMDPAIAGSEGHRALWAVARKLIQDFGLSDADARSIVDEYNARCEPPWSEREIEHKLAQARKARVSNPIAERAQ